MRTAVRIFWKDVRHLWPVIAVVWAIQALSIYTSRSGDTRSLFGGLLDAVVIAPVLFLVVLAIHDEALCDARQFWLTRPYSRWSLLAGKALFAFVFANLTFFVSDIIRCALADLPIGFQLPHLLWRQVCFTGWLILTAAAVATVTATLVQAVIACVMFAGAAPAIGYITSNTFWYRLAWLQLLPTVALLAATALAVILSQYNARRTILARCLLAGGTLLALFARPLMPLKPALALQSRLTGTAPGSRNVQIAFDPDPNRSPNALRGFGGGRVPLAIPFRVSGVPRGMRINLDLAKIRFQGGGTEWDSGWTPYIYDSAAGGPALGARMEPRVYESMKDRPVEIRTSVVITLIAADLRHTVVNRAGRFQLPSGEPCFAENWFPRNPFVRCELFDGYAVIVDAREKGTARDWLGSRMANYQMGWYGPDPVDFAPTPYSFGFYQFSPSVTQEWDVRTMTTHLRPFRSDSELIFTVERPVAHVLREFSASGLRLSNYRAWEMQ